MSFAPVSIEWRVVYPVVACALVAAGLIAIFSPQGPVTTDPEPVPRPHVRFADHRQGGGPVPTKHRLSAVDSRSRISADRLAAAASGEPEKLDGLRSVLSDQSSSPGDRVFACQKLALLGSGDAMQALFEAITLETDLETKRQMCESLDLLTNEEGIVALASVAVATDDLLLLQSVEDCLARCATQETVLHLAELHGEFHQDPAVAARLCSLLESVHSPQATTALAGLLRPGAPADLFRSASIALAKSPGRDAARELVNATRRPLSDEQKDALREVIAASIEPTHLPVFRDEAGETHEEFWISAFSLALEKELVP